MIKTAISNAALHTTLAYWIRVITFGLIQSTGLAGGRFAVASAGVPSSVSESACQITGDAATFDKVLAIN
jgi:hypothetical protein